MIQNYWLIGIAIRQVELHFPKTITSYTLQAFFAKHEGNISPHHTDMVKNVELLTTLSSKSLFQKLTIARTVKNLAARGLKKKDTASQRILMNG